MGNPVAYTAPDGRQRVAVYTGVGWLAGGLAGGTCPYVAPGEDGGSSPKSQAVARYRGKVGLAEVRSVAAPQAGPTSGMLHVFKLP